MCGGNGSIHLEANHHLNWMLDTVVSSSGPGERFHPIQNTPQELNVLSDQFTVAIYRGRQVICRRALDRLRRLGRLWRGSRALVNGRGRVGHKTRILSGPRNSFLGLGDKYVPVESLGLLVF